MAEPDAAGFKLLFTRWALTDAAVITPWLDQAALRFTASRFGLQWTMAAYLFAAHNLATATGAVGEEEARGPVTSESVGDVSRSYGGITVSNVPASLMEFMTTSYGLRLIGIILSRSSARARVITDWPTW